jgi:transcriptional regulator with XRE-family HTH domain
MRTKYLSLIGRKVRRRREQLSLSQSTLALRAGVHTNVIGRLERGLSNPTVLTLVAISQALRTSITRLV